MHSGALFGSKLQYGVAFRVNCGASRGALRGAFKGCMNLKSIIFPSSVREFGQNILAECTSLQRIYYAARDTEWQKDLIGVPRSVTTYLEFSYDQAVEHNLAEVGASKRKLEASNESSTKRLRASGALYDWTRGER